MKALHLAIGAGVAAGLAALAFSAWAPAAAQKPAGAEAKLPDSFPYSVRNGRRVPKEPVKNADGSFREEVREAGCVTIREKNAAGEYRETRKCD